MFLKSTKCSNMSCGTFAKAKKMITRQDVRTVLLGYNYITAGMLEAAAVPVYNEINMYRKPNRKLNVVILREVI